MNSVPILIVEDDRKTAALIETYLRKEGYSTIKATDGIEAIELFTSETPRLVVLDVMLPRLDGFAVCSEIRKESQVPILFLTARDDEVDCVLGLTNILGYTEGLRDTVIAPDTAVFSLIHEESQRLVNLDEDLMQLARADVARSSLKRERININDLIQQTIQQFRRRLDEKSIQVRFQASVSVEVDADLARIIQVLTNLMENAWRYSPVGGTIDIHIIQANSSVKVQVVNEAEEEAIDPASLFERFRRGDSSRSRHSGGAGLGLAIVKELIHAHGGQIGSQFRNGMAEFWFELPAVC